MAERRGNKDEILTQFDQLLPSRVPTSKTEGVHNPDFLASERLAVYSKSSIFCIIIIRSIIGLTVKLDKRKERGVIELRCSIGTSISHEKCNVERGSVDSIGVATRGRSTCPHQ